MAKAGAAMSEPLCNMSVRFHSLCCLVDFQTTRCPVRQLAAGKVRLQPIQVGVGATEESARVADAEAAVGEAEQRPVSVGGEFITHHAVLDNRLLPFVFEH